MSQLGQARALLYSYTGSGVAQWIASANRGFYGDPSPVAIDIQTDQDSYGPNDTVNLSVTLTNQTEAFTKTSLILSVSGALPASVFNQTIPVDLTSGTASLTSSFTIPNVTIPSSSNEVYLSAELRDKSGSNSSVIGFAYTTFHLNGMATNNQLGGGLEIISTPPDNVTFAAGQAASFTYQIRNPGSNVALTAADFEIPGIYENETILVIRGNSTATITYEPTIPVDQPAGQYGAVFTVMGDSTGTAFNVDAVTVNVTAVLNKKLYGPNETAHLSLNITNLSSLVGQDLKVKVYYGSFKAEPADHFRRLHISHHLLQCSR